MNSAQKYPEAPAVQLGQKKITYAELELIARKWAHAVVSHLGRPARRIGVFGYRNETSYIGVLAALFSGAAFVPLNKNFPVRRTRRMIALADLDAIIVDTASARQLEEILAGQDRMLVLLPEDNSRAFVPEGFSSLTKNDIDTIPPLRTLPVVSRGEIAYLLFTSGSTGEPKGVPVTHANVLHFLDVMTKRYEIRREDRFSQTFDQTFDLSVFDLFMAWQSGACVCAIQPKELLSPERFVRMQEITIWFSVPSLPVLMLRKHLLRPNSMPTLRLSLFCGEPLPMSIAMAWQEAAPHSIVENLYGPTEVTIACFAYTWDSAKSPDLCVNGLVPIGRPYSGLGALVVDDNFRPVPERAPGELIVCGPQTVPGYWRNPDQTTTRFITLSDPELENMRFFRTGDQVQELECGEFVFLGRRDDQIKVLGHRVELSEIEAVLRQSSGLDSVAAVGWPVVDGSAQGIIGFLNGDSVDIKEVRAVMSKSLPTYMVPSEIYVLDQFPLNLNRKIDRKALIHWLDEAAEVKESVC